MDWIFLGIAIFIVLIEIVHENRLDKIEEAAYWDRWSKLSPQERNFLMTARKRDLL